MSFKLTPPFKKNPTPIVNMPLGDDIMGRADKRGNILLNQDGAKFFGVWNLESRRKALLVFFVS